MSNPNTKIKQERHDEAEIRELAAKMVEQNKQHMAKAAIQQQASVNAQKQQMPHQMIGNQTNILNYLTRPANKTVVNVQPTPSTSNIETDKEKLSSDEESQKGRYGWATFEDEKIFIPYISRQGEKYCSVRMVEMKLLNKYLNFLHQDIYCCTCVRSYYITEIESRLFNEINQKHCDYHFGRESFTAKDLVVRLTDANKFYEFLDVCHRKLSNGSNTPNQKCGFIRINKESVVPYTIRGDGQKMVPLFYFEGETDNLKLKADYLSGWDLSYLKFCCKVQGIRNELFASDSVAVISLNDIKGYFPPGTTFEDYWPSKVVDSQLLLGPKHSGNNGHWTRQPAHPPKSMQINAVSQVKHINNQAPRSKPYSAYPQNNTLQRNNTQTDISAAVQALTSGWAAPQDLDPITRQQQHLLLNRMNQRAYSGQANVQNLLTNTLYQSYAANQELSQVNRAIPAHQIPTLGRNQPAVTAAMPQLAGFNGQARNNSNLISNNRTTNLNIMSTNSRAQQGANSYRTIPNPQDALGTPYNALGTSSYPPYKVQEALIENTRVPCINMNAYSYTDFLITIHDLKETIFQQLENQEALKRVLVTLDIPLYKGNRMQYQALLESGIHGVEGVPLVLVRDVISHMPQLNYIVKHQDLHSSSKRLRTS